LGGPSSKKRNKARDFVGTQGKVECWKRGNDRSQHPIRFKEVICPVRTICKQKRRMRGGTKTPHDPQKKKKKSCKEWRR